MDQGEPPAPPKPNPRPPSPEEAARIVTEAWNDRDWGTLIWVAMTSAARRGELCALRWPAVDLTVGRETMWLRSAIGRTNEGWGEGDLKTHQQRRVALDPQTAAILRDHRDKCLARANSLRITLLADAFLFSGSPDGSTFPAPSGLTQRYDRLVRRLGIDSTLHNVVGEDGVHAMVGAHPSTTTSPSWSSRTQRRRDRDDVTNARRPAAGLAITSACPASHSHPSYTSASDDRPPAAGAGAAFRRRTTALAARP
jgi:hypothetical protein